MMLVLKGALSDAVSRHFLLTFEVLSNKTEDSSREGSSVISYSSLLPLPPMPPERLEPCRLLAGTLLCFVFVCYARFAHCVMLPFVEPGLSTETAFFYSVFRGQAASRL